jgi:hypothetical protein
MISKMCSGCEFVSNFNGMTGIFISYRQDDAKPWALLLSKELAGMFGEDRVFLDKDALRAGNWRAQIHEALNQCRVVLVVIGRRWLTITDDAGTPRLNHSDDVHRQEIALALSRKDVTVIPVLVDGVAMPRTEDLPMDIRSLTDQQSRELSDGRARREVDMQLLIEDIRRITGLKGNVKDQTPIKNGPKTAGLRASLLTMVAISVLSLAVWVFFYIAQPGQPLTTAETIIVLAICSVLVLSAKRIWVRLHNRSITFYWERK